MGWWASAEKKTMKTFFRSFGLIASVCVGSVAIASASDSSSLQLPFLNLGVDPDATATLSAQLGAHSSQLTVKAANLVPGQSYTLRVWEVSQFTTNADSKGRWQASFRTPNKKGAQPLDFDPRGQTVSLVSGIQMKTSSSCGLDYLGAIFRKFNHRPWTPR